MPAFLPDGVTFAFFGGHFNIWDLASSTMKEKVELPIHDICLMALRSGSTDGYVVSERGIVSGIDSHPDVIRIADFKERVVAVIINIAHHLGYSSL
jgi:hypothetical protein